MFRARRLMLRLVTRSWTLSRIRYRLHGIRLQGKPADLVWYFAFGVNMHDSAFIERRGMRPRAWRVGRLSGYRLRFNLEGRPAGKAAPANVSPDADVDAEVCGVLYLVTRAEMLRLDASEGVPGMRYRHLWAEVEDTGGERLTAMTYIAEGKELDGSPSLRYISLLREGARAHGLPAHYIQYLDNVRHAE
jgi:cation transport regulator ChaC